MQVTRPLAECLLRLKNGPDFQAFRDWLDGSLQEARGQCESLEGVQLHRAQGRAKAYGQLQDLIKDSREILDKVARQQ